MRFLGLLAAIMMALGLAVAQVTQTIAPQGAPPAGCSPSRPGTFEMAMIPLPKGNVRAVNDAPPLRFTIANGVLTDAKGRIGYIADNYQFQFDGPPQAGAIYTGGFSICENGTVALGSSAVFWACPSGGFSNLYDRYWAPQCFQSYFQSYDITPKPSSISVSASVPTISSTSPVSTSFIATTSSIIGSSIATTTSLLASDLPVATGLLSNSTTTSLLLLSSLAPNASTVSLTSTVASTTTGGRTSSSSAAPKPISNSARSFSVTARVVVMLAGLAGIALA